MNKVYLEDFGGWNKTGDDDYSSVAGNFEITESEPPIIWACYEQECYEGSACIVFQRNGKWYLVEGSHCSCYGLEQQWQPEEFDPKQHLEAVAIGKRLAGAYLNHKEELDTWLKEMVE